MKIALAALGGLAIGVGSAILGWPFVVIAAGALLVTAVTAAMPNHPPPC